MVFIQELSAQVFFSPFYTAFANVKRLQGYEKAREFALKFLEKCKITFPEIDKSVLLSIARTALMTKLHPEMANL